MYQTGERNLLGKPTVDWCRLAANCRRLSWLKEQHNNHLEPPLPCSTGLTREREREREAFLISLTYYCNLYLCVDILAYHMVSASPLEGRHRDMRAINVNLMEADVKDRIVYPNFFPVVICLEYIFQWVHCRSGDFPSWTGIATIDRYGLASQVRLHELFTDTTAKSLFHSLGMLIALSP